MQVALQLGLVHGLVLSLLMTGLVVASLRQDPLIWLRSSPRDVQAKVGPPPAASVRRRRGWGAVLLVILLGTFGHLASALPRPFAPGSYWVASWIAFQVFNLYDALVIDLGLVFFGPDWAFAPGTRALPGLRDPRWHVGNYLKGLVGGFVFATLATGLAWLALAA